MHKPYTLGQIAQLKVELRAAQKGFTVSRPTTEARYDLIIDDGSVRHRAQIKYAGECNGDAIYVDLRKETRNNGKKRTYSAAEIDCVLVYAPKIDAILWLPPESFHGRGSVSIRMTEPKTTNQYKTNFADNLRW